MSSTNQVSTTEQFARLFGFNPFTTFPVLELQEKRDYVDFIKVEDMKYPIMSFNDRGRKGLAVKLTSRYPVHLDNPEKNFNEAFLPFFLENIQDKYVSGVATFFQRYSNDDSTWVYGLGPGLNKCLGTFYDNVHTDHVGSKIMSCPTCPPYLLGCLKSVEWLEDLVRNRDMLLRIQDS